MTRNKSCPGQGTNNPALDDVRPLDVPLPSPTTFSKVTMPTNHRLRLDQDRINMQMLRKAKGDPNDPYTKLYNKFIILFPPEEDVLVDGQWKVKSTSADVMDKEYEESEALAWQPSAHLDEQSKIKGTKKPWPAHLRSDRAPFFGKSCTRVAVTMSEEWDTARTIMIATEDYGKACAFYYRWMMDVKGARNVSDCPVCLKSLENWPWTMDHIVFQHTSEQIHRLPLQAHNFLGLKVFNYYASPAGRPWVPAHKRFIDEAADRYNADKRALEIARAQRLENN